MNRGWAALLLLLGCVPAAWAHLGSKDVYETIDAGPYRLFVTIRPPNVIPGVAVVEVRISGATVSSLRITPIPLTGEASKHLPASDAMKASPIDPTFYTGSVWMMAAGSWQVKFQAEGAAGSRTASVPVPAMPLSTLKMQPGMGYGLAGFGVFLLVAMAGVVGAAVREAGLPAGAGAPPGLRRRGLVATIVATIVMAMMVYGGAKWWNVEASAYADHIYRPLTAAAQLTGDTLDLDVEAISPNKQERRPGRSNADFLSDHGHLMHLYAIREPQMDAAFHLHPELVAPGDFRMMLPAMPPGDYILYGDVVHANGFPETLVARLTVPAGLSAGKLGPDDAKALPPPLSAGPLSASFLLPDGCTMIWDRPAMLTANTAYQFHFRLVGLDGRPATVMQPYMGMAGHAAFVKTDGTVFAHTHPEGSAAMPAVALANGPGTGMKMESQVVSPDVDFPYGFPSPGSYRIFIQMKRAGTIETGVFDAAVR